MSTAPIGSGAGRPFLLLIGFSFGLLACSGPAETPSPDRPSAEECTDAPSSPLPAPQPTEGCPILELAVVQALEGQGRPLAVRYERDENRVLVTIYTRDDPMTDDDLREAERRAEQVSRGIDVVISTTDEAPPVEAA